MGGGRHLTVRRGGLIDDAAGAYKMLVVVAIVHVADHYAGDGGVYKLIVAEIDADMGNSLMHFATQGMEKDKIPFLELVA